MPDIFGLSKTNGVVFGLMQSASNRSVLARLIAASPHSRVSQPEVERENAAQ